MTRSLRFAGILALAIAVVATAVVAVRGDAQARRRVAGRLGPTPGPNSNGHIAAQRAYLERVAASDPTRRSGALVSFTRFLAPNTAGAIVAGMRARVVFVRFPDGEPQALRVIGDPSTAVVQAAVELRTVQEAEIRELRSQLARAPTPRRKELADLLAERERSLRLLGPACPCVFGIAVERTTLGRLRDLAHRGEVRLVDVPEPVVSSLAGFKLTPLMPAAAPIVPPQPTATPVPRRL